jgi:microsomal dipeptidase-like Zn-dependent dipeptidase
MRYFDFHCHILLKQLFAEHPNIDTRMSRKDIAGIPRACTDLPNILQTQIHQSQLSALTGEVLVGVVLYGLESYLAEQVIPLRRFLCAGSQDKMWLPLFRKIADVSGTPLYKMFDDFTVERTLNRYLQASASLNVVTKKSFGQPLPKNKVNIFFLVEGCHSLVNTALEAPLSHASRKYPPDEILKNLDSLLQKAQVLSVNLTHMQQSNLCNHAFGMQLASDKPFRPRGNGLTDEGRKVVQSLRSRLDLLNEIEAGRYQNVQPVNCTHTGFTGTSIKDWPGYIWQKKPVDDVYYIEVAKTMQIRNSPRRPGAPAFNMTTINLFDEEIAWIVRHGGMIGLSMDRRILGYVDPFDDLPTGRVSDSLLYVDKEYISKAEWAALYHGRKTGYLISDQDCVSEDDVRQSTGNGIPARNEYFSDHILLHLKHYLQVCVNAGVPLEQAQKQITIGSDFDGIINPFINIATVEDMPALSRYILANFDYYLGSLRDAAKWKSQVNIPAFVEGLFYENGYRYVRNFFSASKAV